MLPWNHAPLAAVVLKTALRQSTDWGQVSGRELELPSSAGTTSVLSEIAVNQLIFESFRPVQIEKIYRVARSNPRLQGRALLPSTTGGVVTDPAVFKAYVHPKYFMLHPIMRFYWVLHPKSLCFPLNKCRNLNLMSGRAHASLG